MLDVLRRGRDSLAAPAGRLHDDAEREFDYTAGAEKALGAGSA